MSYTEAPPEAKQLADFSKMSPRDLVRKRELEAIIKRYREDTHDEACDIGSDRFEHNVTMLSIYLDEYKQRFGVEI